MRHNKTKKHEGRTDLVGEHKWGDLGQMILLLIFAIVWITDSFIWKYSFISIDKIPNLYRLAIALPILACSGYLAKKGLDIIFGEKRAKSEVVSNGVFGIVRHPIYLGSILFYMGMTIIACSIASFIVCIVIVIFYFCISKYEEKILLEELGSDYRDYMQRVPMLIPKIFRRK
jgi:protein-S-isoprenylcysteine O-methyltransferase Ste14